MSFWQKTIEFLFCVLFFLVPLAWLPNTSELFEFNKMILVYLFTALIIASWLCRMIAEKKFIFRHTPLDWPLLLFLLFTFISLLFSIDIHTSWFGYYSRWNGGLLSLFSYALLYWAFVSNITNKSIPKLINWLLITAGITAIYGGLEHFGFSPSCLITRGQWNVSCWVQDVQNRVFATLGQPNWLAAYIATLIFIPISAIISKLKTLNHAITFLLLFLALLFTKSRSGLLAFAISSLVFWSLIFSQFKSNLKQFLILSLSFTFCVLTFTFLIPNPIRDLVIKSSTPAPVGPALEVGGTESGAIRKIVWTGATRIWTSSLKNFLIGTGPETFAMAYYQYRPIEHNATSEWELLYNKAHNEFLNYLTTTGLLGLLSYLVLLGFMGHSILNTDFVTLREQHSTLKAALFAGWLSISITNFWGFSVVVVQLLLFLLPAVAITQNDN